MKFYLLLLLGYLCFCIAIDPTESSDWRPSAISNKSSSDNCTQCEDERQDVSCKCSEFLDECIICCSGVTCCICEECAPCWSEQRQLIIMTEIVICTLFAFGIIGLVIVYCKICNRARHTRTRRRRTIILHEARDLTQCCTIESLRERPPSYNEVVRSAPVNSSSCNNAPPLYTSPYNRTSMQEAPPSYPGTPNPQEKSQDSNEPPFLLPVAQHM